MRKSDIFISYSRKDTQIVDEICKALDEQNISYFIDRKGLTGGGEFPVELEEAIDNAHIVLYIASHNSYKSKFTIGEITYAFNVKEHGSIIPYVIDGSNLLSVKGMGLIFGNINIRNIQEHPIDTVLMHDLCERLNKTYKLPEAIAKERVQKELKEKLRQEEIIREQERILREEQLKKQKIQEDILRRMEERRIEELRKVVALKQDKEKWEQEQQRLRKEEREKIEAELKSKAELEAKVWEKKSLFGCGALCVIIIATIILGIWLGIKYNSFWIGFTIFFTPSVLALCYSIYMQHKGDVIKGNCKQYESIYILDFVACALFLPLGVWKGLIHESFWTGLCYFYIPVGVISTIAIVIEKIHQPVSKEKGIEEMKREEENKDTSDLE